jgi:cytochrome c oxidase cbb3-type subunit 4
MNHSTYEFLRQLADSWVLMAMGLVFLVLVAWPFRSGARDRNREAANLIFKDDSDGQ